MLFEDMTIVNGQVRSKKGTRDDFPVFTKGEYSIQTAYDGDKKLFVVFIKNQSIATCENLSEAKQKIEEDMKGTKDTDSIEFSKLMELVKEGRIEIDSWINFKSGQSHGIVEIRGTNNKISSLTVENIPDNYKP